MIRKDHLLHEGEPGIFGIDCPDEPLHNPGTTYEKIWMDAQKMEVGTICRHCKEILGEITR